MDFPSPENPFPVFPRPPSSSPGSFHHHWVYLTRCSNSSALLFKVIWMKVRHPKNKYIAMTDAISAIVQNTKVQIFIQAHPDKKKKITATFTSAEQAVCKHKHTFSARLRSWSVFSSWSVARKLILNNGPFLAIHDSRQLTKWKQRYKQVKEINSEHLVFS